MISEQTSKIESEWSVSLLEEAKRDLVFVFNIAAGVFGGPKNIPVKELPCVIERMSQKMLEGGCVVGFGDPDSPDWRVPDGLEIPREEIPRAIKKLWGEDPDTYQFLVFALRER